MYCFFPFVTNNNYEFCFNTVEKKDRRDFNPIERCKFDKKYRNAVSTTVRLFPNEQGFSYDKFVIFFKEILNLPEIIRLKAQEEARLKEARLKKEARLNAIEEARLSTPPSSPGSIVQAFQVFQVRQLLRLKDLCLISHHHKYQDKQVTFHKFQT